MKTIARAAAAAVLLALVPVGAAAQGSALEKGAYLLGGSASMTVDDGGGSESGFQASVQPRVEYFVSDGFALGGQIGVSYASRDDFSSTGLLLGPALTYYFVRDGAAHPFLRASGGWVHTRSEAAGIEASLDQWEVRGAAGVLFLVSEGVGLDAQLFVSRLFADELLGDEFDTTRGGLLLGVSAFVF